VPEPERAEGAALGRRAARCIRRPSAGETSLRREILAPIALVGAAAERHAGGAAAVDAVPAVAAARGRAAAVARHTVAAVLGAGRRLLRTGSIPRVNQIEMGRPPGRSQAPAERTRPDAAALDEAALDAAALAEEARPNQLAGPAVALLAGRRATRLAGRGAGVAPRVRAAPTQEPPPARRIRCLAEEPGPPGWQAPAERAPRTTDRTCWWAGSELHSERRRSF